MSASASQLIRFLQQENSRLKQESEQLKVENLALRQYMDALEDLHWATLQITSEENLLNLLDQILYNAMSLLKAEGGSLLLRDEETDELVFVLVHGDIQQKLRDYRIQGDVGVAGWVATRGKPLIVNNPRQDRRFFLEVDDEFGFITRSLLCVPMMTHGKLVGVIELLNKQGNAGFLEADATLLSILAHVAAIALEEMSQRFEAEDALAAAQPEIEI